MRPALARLDARTENLLDLGEVGDLPKERLRERLREISFERDRINTSLTNTAAELQAGAAVLHDYLELARDRYQLYLRADESTRRLSTPPQPVLPR